MIRSVVVYAIFLLSNRLLMSSILFPYTTLFRSTFFACLAIGIGGLVASCSSDETNKGNGSGGSAGLGGDTSTGVRSEEHTSELQSLTNLVCRLLLEKKKKKKE